MFKVTNCERNAVARIRGVYTSLQVAADKAARALLFDPTVSASQKFFLGFASERKKKAVIQKQKVKLLEVLTVIKSEFEACMPTIKGDQLYFKCRVVDENEFDTDRFITSEAQSSSDMISCFEELERRLSKMLSFPEIAEVVQDPDIYTYCPHLAMPENMGISKFFQMYLKELKESEDVKSEVAGKQNPNTSRQKKKNRSKSKKK